jgi:hypothetical protein
MSTTDTDASMADQRQMGATMADVDDVKKRNDGRLQNKNAS